MAMTKATIETLPARLVPHAGLDHIDISDFFWSEDKRCYVAEIRGFLGPYQATDEIRVAAAFPAATEREQSKIIESFDCALKIACAELLKKLNILKEQSPCPTKP